jgi:ABC-type transport system involved in multi-copper enzyme maturation permease subunit
VSAAVIRKTTRDALPLALIVVLGILALECLLVRALGEFADDLLEIWSRHAFLTRLVKALLGADLSEDVTATSLMTIGFAHPLLYAMVWGFLLATCTRATGGEIDRGTADLLLSLPVSRARVYISVSVVWALAGIPECLAPMVGIWLGEIASPLSEPLDLSRLCIAPPNLLALYLAIGGGTMLISSVVSRRGPAIGIMLGVLLGSFLLSFLAQFWSTAKQLSFLGILNYYRPLEYVRTGQWPIGDIAVLCGSALVLWLAGLWWYCRRDVPAV